MRILRSSKLWLAGCALTVLLALCACGGDQPPVTETERPTEGETTSSGATVDTPTEAPTESPTEPLGSDTTPPVAEPAVSAELYAKSMRVDDQQVTLVFESVVAREAGAEGEVTANFQLMEGGNSVSTCVCEVGDGSSGDQAASFSCPADRIAGELTIVGTVTCRGEVLDTVTLKLKNKLPQLTPDGVRCVVEAMTLEEKVNLVTGIPETSKPGASAGTYPIERLGVPATLFMDGPAGIRYGESVWYPSVTNVSSSWDPALAVRVGECLGEDALAKGFDIVLAPGINIQRTVLSGRNFEYSSEDPLLSGLMIAPYVNGIESTGAGTALKHYAANNQETSRASVSANVTERALREIYLKAFGIVVSDAQPMSVMTAYNRINGIYTAINTDLVNGILRGEFGFEGMVMSDWDAQGKIYEKVNAGNDINTPGWDEDVPLLLEAYQSGVVTDASLNAACYNILNMVSRSATASGLRMDTRVDYVAHGAVATEAAADTMVLLQNENAALPLEAGTKIAVFGNGAFATMFGGSGSGGVTPKQSTTIFAGLCKSEALEVVNEKNNPFEGCAYHDVWDPSKDVAVTKAYAEKMAAAARVAVVVISRDSWEGADRHAGKGDFLLNDTESVMLERVTTAFHAKGGQVIVLINTGSPIEVESWKESVDAILWVGYPGQGAGKAVEQVLTGAVNPSAKTTITWPTSYNSTPASAYFPGSANDSVYYEDIYVGYRYYETFDVGVSYPFGYGLSYTDFAYSDFTLEKHHGGTVTATVTVKNTGSVAGREIVELYVSKPETLQEQAALELCGFTKTRLLAPGESETVTIEVREEALMTYETEKSHWVISEGTYTYSVGASVADLRGETTVDVAMNESLVVQDVENRCEPEKQFDYIQKATYKVPGSADARVNLATGKPITSNHNENSDLPPEHAVDGNYTTRWSGLGLSDATHHILDIDLGEVHAIGEFKIIWESIHAPFSVQYSTDGVTYTEFGSYLDDGAMRTEINLFGAEARYIRLSVTRTGGYISIFEIEMYEATPEDIEAGKDYVPEAAKTNIAVGKPVSVSGVEGAYFGANATDGDFGTRWGSLPTGEGWIVVDLEEVIHITGIQILLESAWVPYVVEYSTDGETYVTLHEALANELLVKETALSIDARYIRMRRDGENWFSVYEIMVYKD